MTKLSGDWGICEPMFYSYWRSTYRSIYGLVRIIEIKLKKFFQFEYMLTVLSVNIFKRKPRYLLLTEAIWQTRSIRLILSLIKTLLSTFLEK